MTHQVPNNPHGSRVRVVAKGNTAFALDLYQQLRTQEGNLFFSPDSISTALAMTCAGVRGDTEAQMAQALHFDLGQDELHPAYADHRADLARNQAKGDVALHTANSLWPQMGYTFLPAFLDLCQRYYGVAITPVNYAADPAGARQQINAWVEAMTQDKIKELLKPHYVTPLTTLILVNAIYFKGNWASQFDEQDTDNGPFYRLAGDAVAVPMMSQKARFGYRETDELQVLELPYVGGDLSMVVLLPRDRAGLPALEVSLTADSLALWTESPHPAEVRVLLPRFRLTGEFDLGDTLVALGVRDAFTSAADFSGMTGQRDLFISNVVHKAMVEVNEEGTEAAAATAVAMAKGVPSLEVFEANHPFLFLLRENSTGSVLFLGRVVDPTAES